MTPAEFKQARQKLGLTQKALAVQLGVTPQTVWRYERGRRSIPPVISRLMAMILDANA